jgi:hypothetical protein
LRIDRAEAQRQTRSSLGATGVGWSSFAWGEIPCKHRCTHGCAGSRLETCIRHTTVTTERCPSVAGKSTVTALFRAGAHRCTHGCAGSRLETCIRHTTVTTERCPSVAGKSTATARTQSFQGRSTDEALRNRAGSERRRRSFVTNARFKIRPETGPLIRYERTLQDPTRDWTRDWCLAFDAISAARIDLERLLPLAQQFP